MLIVDITIDGKRKHKEITGYSTYPEGFTFFETFINDYDNKAVINPVLQNTLRSINQYEKNDNNYNLLKKF